MVCPSCRYAGTLAGKGREYLFSPPEEFSSEKVTEHFSSEKVTELHEKCPGRTWCDCQHVIPPRRPAIS